MCSSPEMDVSLGKARVVNTQLLVGILHLRPSLKDLGVPPYNSEHLLKWI